jgi:superfamily II DNA or RNA helicase
MKESELKESEKKQCVLATYSMAAEGLDIKTLSTIVMTTPMTRIEQATGRILREKHDFGATIVDIIDTHDNFQRQWLKRKAFYKKQNYKIIHTNSLNYTPDVRKWKTIFEPIKKGETNCVDDDDDEDDSDDSDTSDTKTKKPSGVCLLKMKNKK